jgi:hypothetical protein
MQPRTVIRISFSVGTAMPMSCLAEDSVIRMPKLAGFVLKSSF